MSTDSNVTEIMAKIGQSAAAASHQLGFASSAQKKSALLAMADAVWKNRAAILDANGIDMPAGREKGLSASFLDRLKLDESRVQGICDGIRAIAELDDPVGAVIANGIDLTV